MSLREIPNHSFLSGKCVCVIYLMFFITSNPTPNPPPAKQPPARNPPNSPYNPKNPTSTLGTTPLTISATTHPVPKLKLIPHAPCPAATHTPLSPSTPPTTGVPRLVTGRQHTASLSTTTSSPNRRRAVALRTSIEGAWMMRSVGRAGRG